MFFGFSSTIISIIFGLGLNWILILAGQDLFHKLTHHSKADDIEICAGTAHGSIHQDIYRHDHSLIDEFQSKNYYCFSEVFSGYSSPDTDVTIITETASAFSLRGPPLNA